MTAGPMTAVERDKVEAAYSEWAWLRKGEPIGYLQPHIAARIAFRAGAEWAAAAPAPGIGREEIVEAAMMARRRLESFADAANAGHVHHDARELKRRIWAAFAEMDTLLSAQPAPTQGSGDVEQIALMFEQAAQKEGITAHFWWSEAAKRIRAIAPPAPETSHHSGQALSSHQSTREGK